MAIILVFHEDHPFYWKILGMLAVRSMNSNWIGHQGVGVRGMVATRRGKKSHFGTCPGAHRGNSPPFLGWSFLQVWWGSCCSQETWIMCIYIYNDFYQFVALCNQSVSGIHVQLQKTASFCMLLARWGRTCFATYFAVCMYKSHNLIYMYRL